jgi:hypothetical protein
VEWRKTSSDDKEHRNVMVVGKECRQHHAILVAITAMYLWITWVPRNTWGTTEIDQPYDVANTSDSLLAYSLRISLDKQRLGTGYWLLTVTLRGA